AQSQVSYQARQLASIPHGSNRVFGSQGQRVSTVTNRTNWQCSSACLKQGKRRDCGEQIPESAGV
ncbi:hypothetical protein NL317_28880, partial [Klebsiella pneumoniae]|nr:hypothetical protein [Klebsiella pneumoniae]